MAIPSPANGVQRRPAISAQLNRGKAYGIVRELGWLGLRRSTQVTSTRCPSLPISSISSHQEKRNQVKSISVRARVLAAVVVVTGSVSVMALVGSGSSGVVDGYLASAQVSPVGSSAMPSPTSSIDDLKRETE